MGEARETSFGRSDAAASGNSGAGGEDGAGADARDLVCRRLAEDAQAFPGLSIEPLETRGLEARDAALAGAIHREAVRRWLTLEGLIGHALDRPVPSIEPGVRAALLAGTTQLVLLDRVPAHAAIHESVEWAKRNVRPKAGGLVNAVLRRISRLVGERVGTWDVESRRQIPRSDGGAVELREDVLPSDPLERLATTTSVPVSLVAKWAKDFGEETARAMAIHTLVDPPIVLNVAHAASGIDDALAEAHESAGSAVFLGTRAQLGDLLASRADVWVQDAASCEAVRMVGDLTPSLIVDSCAGLGTKTRQLAATFPNARIIASDVDQRRMTELRRLFDGHERVRVVEHVALGDAARARADLVLLDVPCSNTGVLPRRPEAKYRVSRRQQDRLVKIQRQVIRDSIEMLAAGGRVLYSTCSVEREEDESQVEWAARELGFTITRTGRHAPQGGAGEAATRYRDGAFACLLER
ncbi:MAG: transcription antitermination factor NusB [Phycisphaerales bacterium]